MVFKYKRIWGIFLYNILASYTPHTGEGRRIRNHLLPGVRNPYVRLVPDTMPCSRQISSEIICRLIIMRLSVVCLINCFHHKTVTGILSRNYPSPSSPSPGFCSLGFIREDFGLMSSSSAISAHIDPYDSSATTGVAVAFHEHRILLQPIHLE